jgi:hypothetical protein
MMLKGARRSATQQDRGTRKGLFAVFSVAAALALMGFVGSASADPINSHIPGASQPGTLVCGDITYTVVSPPGPTPVGQMVTATIDGTTSNSTSVQIMILDKASAFPQDKLTQCTFTSPENFDVDLLITPVR